MLFSLGITILSMKILLVEDELKLASAIKKGFEQEGWVCETASNSTDAFSFLSAFEFDVLVLDRMLDDNVDGIEICRQLRQQNNSIPTLMLTALNEVSDRITGLDVGADDYLGKPFDFGELIARVKSLSRRPSSQNGPVCNLGNIRIDLATKTVSVNESQVETTKKEFSLIEYLVLNRGITVSKDQIIEKVWDFDSDILPNTVEATVKNIRKKIKSHKGDDLIQTVRGFGYKIAKES